MADDTKPLGDYVAGEPFTQEEILAVCPWLAEFMTKPPGPTGTYVVISTNVREGSTLRIDPED